MDGRAETELAKALDAPMTRISVTRPGYFFPAHANNGQMQQSPLKGYKNIDRDVGFLIVKRVANSYGGMRAN